MQAQPTVPDMFGLDRTAIIIGACLLCLLIIPRTIRYPHTGAKMPLPLPSLFNNPSIGSFLASMVLVTLSASVLSEPEHPSF